MIKIIVILSKYGTDAKEKTISKSKINLGNTLNSTLKNKFVTI